MTKKGRIPIFANKNFKMDNAKYRVIKIQSIREDRQIYEVIDDIVEIGLPQYLEQQKGAKKHGRD